MTNHFTPRAYQLPAIDHMIRTLRCALWVPMGGGKTISVLTALTQLDLAEDVFPALIIAPLRVAQSTWPDELRKWSHLSHLTASPIVGNTKERLAALKAPTQIYTINYENLPWLVEQVGESWPFKTIIADEATKLKSFRTRQGSKRAKALAKVAFKSSRFVELTGTPSPNGLIDLWGQAWFLDKGQRLGRSFEAFQRRWFRSIQVGADRFAVRLEPFDHSRKEIEDALRDICLSVDLSKFLQMEEPIVSTVSVELPTKAKELYKAMEREMYFQLQEHEVEAVSAAARTMKCLQLASGAIYTDDTGNFEPIHDAKIDALESIIEEANGAPVLVAYHFKSDLARLLKAFPKGRHLDKDPQTIRDWNAGKVPVLFAHPASAGHGLNLQDGGNILVFFSHNWNLEEYQQIVERIGPARQAQAGHHRPVFIYHIVARDTVDELVMLRRETKREVQDLLMEAMRK